MPFCAKCGTEIPEGAGFCPKCGTQVGAVVRAEKQDHSGLGGTLILIGGILALISSILPLLLVGMWRSLIDWMGRMIPWIGMDTWRWNMPLLMGRWMMGFIFAGAVISIILGIVTIYAYTRVRAGEIRSAGTIVIVLGVIMLLTMNWLTGLLTLVGGILCYTSE